MDRRNEGDAASRSSTSGHLELPNGASAPERSISTGISRNRIGPAAGVSPESQAGSASSYDEIPYDGQAIADTHPDHMAAIAALFGIESPDPARCRVLELGCARGDS